MMDRHGGGDRYAGDSGPTQFRRSTDGRQGRSYNSPSRFPNGGGGFENENEITLSGHKRGRFPPDRVDGSGFAKLFVGSVPRTATEEEVQQEADGACKIKFHGS